MRTCVSLSKQKPAVVNVQVAGTMHDKCSAKFNIALCTIHATLRWMCYDKDIDKYKCGPAVTTLSDVASPNAERTGSVLLLINSW